MTAEGGPTSHTAILARALGIPAVVSCPEVLAIAEGTVLVLDGATGTIDAAPDEATVTEARDRAARAAARNRRWDGPGATADGHRIKLLANIGDAAGAQAAAAAGAEGVGLFRTEFLFLDRADEPSESEQTESYAAVFGAFGEGTKIVVRTLDAGADKPLPFLDQGEEANPALGVRGLRIGLAQPEVLDKQLRAIAAAARSTKADVWVMAPMVAVLSEAQAFDRHAREAGLRTTGVMIEIPAAALSAREMLGAVDFVSIGTNDLAQYTLAADRMSGPLAALNDPWQPALLRLIGMVRRRRRGRGQAGRHLRRGGRRPGARAGAGRARRHQPVDVGTVPVRRGRRAQDGDPAAVPRPRGARGRGRGRRRPGAPPFAPPCPPWRSSACDPSTLTGFTLSG